MVKNIWTKASRSAATGDCVEALYTRSSRSMTNGSCVEVAWMRPTPCSGATNCVEVGSDTCGSVHVRDSKDRDGPALNFTPEEWIAFIEGAKGGEFDFDQLAG